MATNRTILELKLQFRREISSGKTLPIAPYWNWNTDRKRICRGRFSLPIAPYWNWNLFKKALLKNGLGYQSHHTGIETGLVFKNIFQSNWLPIAPYWNWNWLNSMLWMSDMPLPIAPYWNWNGFSSAMTEQKILLPIAPYWNWNLVHGFEILSEGTATNRTILELKLRSIKGRTPGAFYQSHHTGIETF